MLSNRLTLAALILTLATLAAGQTTRAFDPVERQRLSTTGSIVVLPAVDGRTANILKVNLEKLRKDAQRDLQKKGYATVLSSSAPPGAWAMAVALDGTSSQRFNPTVGVSGKLSDDQGRIVWEGTGFGTYHSANEQPVTGVYRPQDQMQLAAAGALTDLLFNSTGWARGEALDNAVFNLLQGIPSHPKPKKK